MRVDLFEWGQGRPPHCADRILFRLAVLLNFFHVLKCLDPSRSLRLMKQHCDSTPRRGRISAATWRRIHQRLRPRPARAPEVESSAWSRHFGIRDRCVRDFLVEPGKSAVLMRMRGKELDEKSVVLGILTNK